MAFTDDLIRAAVRTGQYSDKAAADHLASVLMKRRDAIGRAYLTAINPIVNPRLDAAGALTVRECRGRDRRRETASGVPRGLVAFRQRHGRRTADCRDAQRDHLDAAAE